MYVGFEFPNDAATSNDYKSVTALTISHSLLADFARIKSESFLLFSMKLKPIFFRLEAHGVR